MLFGWVTGVTFEVECKGFICIFIFGFSISDITYIWRGE